MGAAVPLRTDFSAGELRQLAKRAGDADQARRLLSLAAVLDGMSRKAAAEIGAMDRQTLRDWAHRFNAKGPAGLINGKAPGPVPKLSAEQKQELRRIVETGPDPARDGVVRWAKLVAAPINRRRRALRVCKYPATVVPLSNNASSTSVRPL